VAPAGVDRLAHADHQPRLRAAEQLVAAEADDRGAGPDRPPHRGLLGQQLDVVGEHAGADVVDHRHPESAERLDLDLLGEAERAEVRRVRAQDRAGALAERGGVVGKPRAVGRADLDEARPRLRDDLRDAEAAADLDELPARDDDVAPRPAERRGGEQHRGGAVVDRERRLGTRDLAQDAFDVGVARSALARGQLELEVRVALGGLGDRRARRGAQRRATEVRVHDDAGGVEHAP
jgi:hypothetical protein